MRGLVLRWGGFLANVLTLLSGSAAARAITVALTPVIARLYRPEYFGVAALFVSLVTITASIGSLRYDQAIVIPASEAEASRLAVLSAVILIGVSMAAWLVLFLAPDVEPFRDWHQKLGSWYFVVPLGIVVWGMNTICISLTIRGKCFGALAKASMAQAGGQGVFRIVVGVAVSSTVGGLIGGFFVGICFALMILLAATAYRFTDKATFSGLKRGDLFALARRYKEFPRYAAPTALLRNVSGNLPIVMMSSFFGPEVVGFYAVSSRLVRIPVNLLSESIRKVYLQKAAEINAGGVSLRPSLIKLTVGMLVGSVIVFGPLSLAGESLFAAVLGDRWATAGRYTAILVPWLVAIFVQAPSSVVFIVLKEQRVTLLLQVISVSLGAIALTIGHVCGMSAEATLIMFSCVGVLVGVATIACGIYIASDYSPPLARGT